MATLDLPLTRTPKNIATELGLVAGSSYVAKAAVPMGDLIIRETPTADAPTNDKVGSYISSSPDHRNSVDVTIPTGAGVIWAWSVYHDGAVLCLDPVEE